MEPEATLFDLLYRDCDAVAYSSYLGLRIVLCRSLVTSSDDWASEGPAVVCIWWEWSLGCTIGGRWLRSYPVFGSVTFISLMRQIHLDLRTFTFPGTSLRLSVIEAVSTDPPSAPEGYHTALEWTIRPATPVTDPPARYFSKHVNQRCRQVPQGWSSWIDAFSFEPSFQPVVNEVLPEEQLLALLVVQWFVKMPEVMENVLILR